MSSTCAVGTDPLRRSAARSAACSRATPRCFPGRSATRAGIVAAIQSGDAEDIAAAIRPLSETLVIATPFIFVGLGLAVSFRAGLFNLGVDGQFLIGGLGAFLTATLVAGSLPPPLALVVAVLGGTIAGGAYGFIPGFLKARTGAHELITTLMLNGIAPTSRSSSWRRSTSRAPPAIPAVPPLFDLPTIRVDYGFVVALGMAAVVSFLLFRTTRRLRAPRDGLQPHGRPRGRHRPGRSDDAAMSLSGGLVGMGSAFFALGPGVRGRAHR